MAVQDGDRFIVNRGGTDYRVSASDFKDKLQDSDKLLINRIGADYSVTGKNVKDYFLSLPSTIRDSDYFVVNRSGSKDYKVSARVLKDFHKQYWTLRSEVTAIDYTDVGVTYDPDYELQDLLFVNGTFYYLWEGQIATSPDAVNWTKISSNGPWASDITGQYEVPRPDAFLSYAYGMFYVISYKTIYESANCINWVTSEKITGNIRMEHYTYVVEATDRNGDDFVWFWSGRDHVMYKYPGDSWKDHYFPSKKPGALCWNNTMKAFNYVVSPSNKVYEIWAGDHIYDAWDIKVADVKNYGYGGASLYAGSLFDTGDTIAYIMWNQVELYNPADLTYITGTTGPDEGLGPKLYANDKIYTRIRYDEGIGDLLYGCSHRTSDFGTKYIGDWGRIGIPHWRTNGVLFGVIDVEKQSVQGNFPSMQFWYAAEKRYIVADERRIWQSFVTNVNEIDYEQAGKEEKTLNEKESY